MRTKSTCRRSSLKIKKPMKDTIWRFQRQKHHFSSQVPVVFLILISYVSCWWPYIGGKDSYKMTMGHLIQRSEFCHNRAPCMLKGDDLKSVTNCLASRPWILCFASRNPCFAVWRIPCWRRSAIPSCRPCQVTVSNCFLPSTQFPCCQSDEDKKSMTAPNGSAESLLDWTASFLLKGLENFPLLLLHTKNIHKSLSPLQFLDVIWDSQDDLKAQMESQWLCSPTLDAILGHPIKQKFDAIVVRRHRDSDWYDMM